MLTGGIAPRHLGVVLALGAALLGGIATVHLIAAGEAHTRDPAHPDFHLTDMDGRPFSIGSFAGKSVLVIYFGYTTCLQACPVALDSIAAALDGLGSEAASVRLVFVDMDPARAATASLPLYMQSFGPSFLGLTGSPDALKDAAQAFDVQVERVQFSDDPNDYAMTHTSPIFVMRPGDPQPSALPATSSPEAIAAAIRTVL